MNEMLHVRGCFNGHSKQGDGDQRARSRGTGSSSRGQGGKQFTASMGKTMGSSKAIKVQMNRKRKHVENPLQLQTQRAPPWPGLTTRSYDAETVSEEEARLGVGARLKSCRAVLNVLRGT